MGVALGGGVGLGWGGGGGGGKGLGLESRWRWSGVGTIEGEASIEMGFVFGLGCGRSCRRELSGSWGRVRCGERWGIGLV